MAWTAPRTWVAGEVVTASIGNTHWRDNLRYLKGLDGAITLSDALILPDGAGYYLHIPILTTVQRDALTPTAGMLIYNSTTTQFNKYENAAWRADLGFNSHHGDLSGLTDDDHTIYQKEDLLTTQGDTIYATAASAWARLAKGTGGQLYRMNAGATAPEWWTASGAVISSGSYTGDSTENRAVAHGLGAIPKLIVIVAVSLSWFLTSENNGFVYCSRGATDAPLAVTAMDATNFYVGNATNYTYSANLTGYAFKFVALS